MIVVPVLISRGNVSEVKFRRDLEGLSVVYRGDPLLPHPVLAVDRGEGAGERARLRIIRKSL